MPQISLFPTTHSVYGYDEQYIIRLVEGGQTWQTAADCYNYRRNPLVPISASVLRNIYLKAKGKELGAIVKMPSGYIKTTHRKCVVCGSTRGSVQIAWQREAGLAPDLRKWRCSNCRQEYYA